MKLLDALQKQLLSMVQSFTLFDIYSTLQALSTYVAKHTTMPYNQDLIKALVSAVLASKVSNDTFVEIVNMLNNMHYADSSVIDELAVRFHRNTKLVQKDFYAAGWPLLRSMNIANHKPPQWTSLQKIISEQIEKIYHRRVWSAIPIIYIFSLDCYLPKLYVNVLNNHNAILQKSSTRLVFLWRGLQQFYPQFFVDYDCNFKNEPDEKPPSLIHLESWLTDRIGGPQYVKMNMYTKLGFFVDCVIAIRSGGYPVAISSENNDSITFVEDIKLRLGNQGIIILCWPHHAYPSNSNSLKSTWQLRLRTIEQSTGFSVIVLDMKHMNKMTDTEKMLYLMDAIKQKCAILNFEYI
ncbi:hypothetical protein KM043_009021 [Ampulex compressa]|nr:hypothetical protein KM043_009021 [Ampulex compressa]